MPTLESVDIQSNRQWSEDQNFMRLSQDTSWLSPKKATMQEMDPLQSGLTFDIQTSPISILVQPIGSSLHTQLIPPRKSESPTRTTNQNAKHDNVPRANSELSANGPRKPLSILSMPSTATQDALESAASMHESNNDSQQLVDDLDSLPTPVMPNVPIPASPKVNGGLSIEPTDMLQVTSSASDSLQMSHYIQSDVDGGPSSSILAEPRTSSKSAQNTTAEAATLALNAAFQSQSVAGPQVQRTTSSFFSKFRLNSFQHSFPGEVNPSQISIQPRIPLYQVEPSNTHNIQEFRKVNHKGPRPAGTTRWKPTLVDEYQNTYAEKASVESQSKDKPKHSQKRRSVQLSTHTSHEIEPPKKQKPKKFTLEAVVIPIRPPFSPSKVRPRRRELESEPESEQQDEAVDEFPLVTKTGPPGAPKGRVRIQKPEVIKSLEQLEEIFQANIATYDIASDDEVEQASASIVASYRILKSQLKSKEPVNDESHLKAPTIAYPRSQPEDRFVDGIESALGPGSLFNIPKKFPKRILQSRVNRVGYAYTSSEYEESEVESASDIPAEEEQGEEAVEPDTIITEAGEDLVPDGIDELRPMDIEVVTNGVENVGSLKRKLLSESGANEGSRRTHPRLEDNLVGSRRTVTTVDDKTIKRWVASLEVLIKGKVKLGRQDLRRLKIILDDIYSCKHSLDEQTLEASQLKIRIRQLSELAIEDIPHSDEENLRQKARTINGFWTRRVESS